MRRSIGQLLAALAAAALLERTLPGLASAGLRATLVLLPVPLALLAAVARAVPAGRARPSERILAAGWILLALGHDRLGLPESAALVAALGLLLVGWRIARLALALVPRLARRREPLDLLPWTATARAPNGDEPYYLLLAHSIVHDLDFDLADEYRDEAWRAFSERPIEPQPGDPTGPAGEIWSRHEPALPILLAPAYALAGRLGAVVVMIGLSALAAGLLVRAALRLPGVGPRGAVAAWALFAFLPPLPLYSQQIWVEVPALLLLLLAVDARLRLRGAPSRARLGDWLQLIVPLALLPLLKLRLLAIAAPFALLALAGIRRQRRLQIALVAGFALAVAAILVSNQLVFGNPLKMHSVDDLAIASIPLERFLRGGVGLWFDLAFGLIAWAPLWLLALPALARIVVRLEPLALEIAAVAPYLLLTASRREWYGGFSPPFRYGLVVLPILALAVGRLLGGRLRPPARAATSLLGALGVPLALAAYALPGWTYHLADGSNHWIDRLGERYAADLLRFLPSAVRPSLATWVVPPLAVALLFVAFSLARRRPRRAAAMGVSGALLVWPALLVAAHHLPTRAIELEDPWVEHRGGLLYPERWVIDRTRFRGGWILTEGSSASVRPVPGGKEVDLRIDWSFIRNTPSPLALEVRAGDRLLARLRPGAPGVWQASRLGPFAWTPGERLTLAAAAPPDAPAANGLVVDRVELDWR